MSDYQNIWQYPSYDIEGSNNPPYTFPDPILANLSIKFTANLSELIARTMDSNGAIVYSPSDDKEYFYIGTYRTEGVGTSRDVAKIDSDGNVLWISPTLSAQITSIIASSNSQSLYCCTSSPNAVKSIDTLTGYINWTYTVYSGAGNYPSSIIINDEGNIAIAYNYSAGFVSPQIRFYVDIMDNITGTYISNTAIELGGGYTSGWCGTPVVADTSHRYFFFVYVINLNYSALPYPYRTRIVKFDTHTQAFEIITLNVDGDELLNLVDSSVRDNCGLAYNNGSVYFSSSEGLFKLNASDFNEQKWLYKVSDVTGWSASPVIASDGTIIYRHGPSLTSLTDNGDSYTINWTTSVLPDSNVRDLTPIIDNNNYIIVPSDNTVDPNIYVFDPDGNVISFRKIGSSSTRYITRQPILGRYLESSSTYYIPLTEFSGVDTGIIYGLYSSVPTTTTTTTPTTTTTTTTTPTTTTTTTGTGTTSTTTPTTTTTTTTTPAPLSIVETLIIVDVNGQLVEQSGNDASDNNQTRGNLLASSLSFGTIAPGETSDNIIVVLNVPNSKAIGNIKLGLISAGGIEFANNIFGITSSAILNADTIPTTYFQGVNTDGLASNSYNISINNNKSNVSEYVYLNLNLPSDNTLGEGVIRLKWFFDYAD